MRARLVLLVLFGLMVGSMAGAGWWFLHRAPDPERHAEMREGQGDLRETLLLRRSAIAKEPQSPEARLRLAQTLLRIFDGVAAEKGFREARERGADQWLTLQGIGEAETLQGHWEALLADIPDTGPTPAITAKFLLLRCIAQIALDQIPAATATVAMANRVAPGQIETMLASAQLNFALQDVAGGEAQVDSVLRADPKQADALLLKLKVLISRNQREEAIAVAGRTIAAAPWSVAPRLERANLYMLANQDAQAQADVDFVLSKFPRLPVARYLNAVLVARTGRNVEADAALESLGPIVDMFPRALFIRARVAAALGNKEVAMSLASRYNTRFPADRDGIVLLAQTQLASNRMDLTIPLLEKAIASARTTPKGLVPADAVMLGLLGNTYAAVGNNAAAFRVRQEAASLAPTNANVLAGLGLSQLRQGETSIALDTLERSANLEAPQPAADIGLFEAAIGVGDFDRATAALARRRAREGESEGVGTMTAMLRVALGDNDGALQAFKAVTVAYPDSVGPKVNLANYLAARGQEGDAQNLLQDILRKDPTDALALNAQLQIWIKNKAWEPAIRAAETAEAAAPGQLRFSAMRADLLTRSGDAKGALSLLQDRRRNGKLPIPLLAVFAQAQVATGALDGAIATFRDILTEAPTNAEARVNLVNLLLSTKRVDEAKASLRDGLTYVPGAYGLMMALASLDGATNGIDAALATAVALRAQPANMPAAALLRGDIFLQAKQFAMAAQAYQLEYDNDPSQTLVLRLANAKVAAGQDDSAALILRAWLKGHAEDPEVAGTLAQLDTKAKRWSDAQTDLEARLRHRPNDAVALNNLAWVYQVLHDPRAREMAQRAYVLSPSGQSADTLGWIMLQEGQTAPALELLQKAKLQLPDEPSLSYHLATALNKTGNADAAIKMLEASLARPEPFDERGAAEKLLSDLRKGN